MEKQITGYPSVDMPWIKNYNKMGEVDLGQYNKSIYQMLEECANNYLDKTAIWMPGKDNKKGIKLSYKKYLEKCRDIAKSFKSLDVKQQEIIPIILPNVIESRGSIYGVNYIGGVTYSIMPSLPAKELEKIIKENEIDKIVIFDGFYEKYKNVLENCGLHCVVVTDGIGILPDYLQTLINLKKSFKNSNIHYKDNIIPWNEFMKNGKRIDLGPSIYEPNSIATIIGTSGTTGIPKGAKFTNESINAQSYQHLLADINFEPGDKLLDILIQSISYGFSVMHYSGCFGLTTVMIPNLVTSEIVKVIEDTESVHFTGGPVHFSFMLKSEDFKNGNFKPLKNAISGGAKLSKELEMELNKDAIYVRQGYGTTECLGGATGPRGEYKLSSIGTPLPLTNMAIFKPGTDHELKYNEIGEICVSGPTIMQGYLNNDEDTKNALIKHSDGKIWLHTKDLGYADEKGRFFFADRITDTFQRCGFNVHPSKINDFISSIQYVKDSFVMGVPHSSEQNVPVALVVLEDKFTKDEKFSDNIKEILLDLCYNNLDEMSIPYDIIFVDSIPRNLGGKVASKELKEKYNLDYSNEEERKFTLQRKN